MVRNPTHVFTFARDLVRYHGRAHRAIVALSPAQVDVLHRVYGTVRPPVVVIPNGVDLERFRPPTAQERTEARAQFQLDDEDRVVLFVGHEFDRKGLPVVIDALQHATTVLLLVAGGNQQSIAQERAHAERAGVADRVLFMGPRGEDLPLFFAASDMFALPSAYEANALVVLEALASGVPVVATRVGYAPDVIVDGCNGFLVDRDPVEVAQRLEELAGMDLAPLRTAARTTAETHGWRATAERYIELLERLRPDLAREAA
jgi:UDP-glucose:(heptosyl)LPS alpha-1,3-glucosyltransferase